MDSKLMWVVTLLFNFTAINSTFAQAPIDQEHNSFRIGDVLKKQRVITDDIWDLSDSEFYGKAVPETCVDFRPDTVTCLFNGMRKYYVFRSDSLVFVGAENPQAKDSLYIPITSRIYPMTLNDKHSGFFADYVSYCDKMKFHKFGTYTIHADSIGTLVLPDGDSIGNALEIKQECRFLYEQIDSCLSDELPMYSEADISLLMSLNSEFFTETERCIYAEGYRHLNTTTHRD